MKIAVVDGQIDELKGNNGVFGRGVGSSSKVAISRAMANMLAQSVKLRRRRFPDGMTFRGTITVTNATSEKSKSEGVAPKTYKAFAASGKGVRVTVPED